jgi:hypothetical protein
MTGQPEESRVFSAQKSEPKAKRDFKFPITSGTLPHPKVRQNSSKILRNFSEKFAENHFIVDFM